MRRVMVFLFVMALASVMTGCAGTDLCTGSKAIVIASRLALTRPELTQAQKDEFAWDINAAQAIIDANCGGGK